jgi:hypothetical protein
MNENVFGPVFRADETEAFLYIEEFHCPDCHGRPPCFSIETLVDRLRHQSH